MNTKRENVSELNGSALDYAVALAKNPRLNTDEFVGEWREGHHAYSESWQDGGPIIECEFIELTTTDEGGWKAMHFGTGVVTFGPTPLIAAMRCYVASKLGDTVEIPEELLP